MDERIEDLFSLYALGALTDEERAQVDAYVTANPEARRRLEDVRRAAAALPYDALPVNPSPRVKAALMERVHADARTRPASRPAYAADISRRRLMLARALPVFAGVSLLVAIALGVWALSLDSEIKRLREERG